MECYAIQFNAIQCNAIVIETASRVFEPCLPQHGMASPEGRSNGIAPSHDALLRDSADRYRFEIQRNNDTTSSLIKTSYSIEDVEKVSLIFLVPIFYCNNCSVVVTDGQVLHRNDDGRPREGSLVNGL